MSLIVQVAGTPAGGPPPPSGAKGGGVSMQMQSNASSRPPAQGGGVLPMQSHAPSRPPPAHVTQLTSSPATPQSAHLVQHHPQPTPHTPHTPHNHTLHSQPQSASYPRSLPLSPHRPHHLSNPRTRVGNPSSSSSRMLLNSPLSHLPTPPMPHLPSSPLPLSMTPTPAHQLHLPTSINSPSHIPQGGSIPNSFLPRLPLHTLPARPLPRGVGLPTTPHPRPDSSPGLGGGHHLDSNILPPHAFRRLLRPTNSAPDDDIEVGDTITQPRRGLMSPKHRERRTYFNNLALQDHNYCAAPPPSPPRSPTPPPSPFPLPSTTQSMSPLTGQALGAEAAVLESEESKSFSLGGGVTPHQDQTSASSGGCVGSYPSPQYSGPPVPQAGSPLSRLRQTIEEAGVGPMTPLAEAKLRDRSRRDSDSKESKVRESRDLEDGGEETETAPEAEDDNQDDSITRCICEFLHDDGYMICCDKCAVWQHVVCMGLDRNNIPDEYLCERCSPRLVDRKRAKALQRSREKELYARLNPKTQEPAPADSSEDEKSPKSLGFPKNKKVFSTVGRGKLVNKKPPETKKVDRKNLKKNHKRRSCLKSDSGKSNDSDKTVKSESPIKKLSPRKNIRRKSTTDESENEGPDPSNLRSWIDTYEEAVTNHYSPQLRARLQGIKLPANFFKPKDINGIRERCNVSLRGNGLKVLTANNFIPSQTPIIECRGKYMLGAGPPTRSRPSPFVLSHVLSPDIEVVVDGKTYGNDSRFCRRAEKSGDANAVVRHHLEKGSLHLYIVASRNIERNQEILLPTSTTAEVVRNGVGSIEEELQQLRRAEVRTSNLVNGSGERRRSLGSNNHMKRRVKRENVKKKERREEGSDSSSEDEEKERPPSPRKTRSAGGGVVEEPILEKAEVKVETVKNEVDTDGGGVNVDEVEEQEVKSKVETKPQTSPKLEIVIPKEEVKEEETSNVESPLKSPEISSPSSILKSPVKPSMGLPDQTGLIVGVNTINYDVSFRNKAKTREEKKMEMIMKAFEAMERAEARKRSEGGDSSSDKPEKKRRRSNSIKANKELNAVDSNLDASSADESSTGGKSRTATKGRGKRTGGVSVRRRSRAKSGDSSALSDVDGGDTAGAEETSKEFKFPRHKRHTGVFPESGDVDDDVSRQYLRGSRSPPGIANHLLRSSGSSKVSDNSRYARQPSGQGTTDKTPALLSLPNTMDVPLPTVPTPPPQTGPLPGCSAKKRWLMSAMLEDTIEDQGSGSPSTVSPEPDYSDYTPLKKRRLASYRTKEEEEVRAASEKEVADTMNNLPTPVNEKLKSLPNGLKKRLISNLVLEAVLDRAMEDFQDRREEKPAEDLRNTGDKEECVNTEEGQLEEHQLKELQEAKLVTLQNEKEECRENNEALDRTKLTKDDVEDVQGECSNSLEEAVSLNSIDADIAYKTEMIDSPDVIGNLSDEDSEKDTGASNEDNEDLNDLVNSEKKHDSKEVLLNSSVETVKETVEESTIQVEENDANEEIREVPDSSRVVEVISDVDVKEEGCVESDEAVVEPKEGDNVLVTNVEIASKDEPNEVTEKPVHQKKNIDETAHSDVCSPVEELEPSKPQPDETVASSPSPSPPPFSQQSSVPSAPPVPMQHSVFKSFFSTDLSVEDIDRQLEAKRVELAREAEQELRSSVSPVSPAPLVCRQEHTASVSPSSEDNSRSGSSLSSHPVTSANAAQEPKKRVSLADYKKRKARQDSETRSESYSTSSSRHTSPKMSPLAPCLLNNPLPLPLPPVRGLPDLPGLESYSGGRGGHGGHTQAVSSHQHRERHKDRHRERHEHHRRHEKVRSSHSSPREHRPSNHLTPHLVTHPALLPPPRVTPLPSPMPEHPREDLTERLRKEFGLNIDESDGEDVDSSGLPDALNARLQGGYDYKLDRDDKRNIGDTRHRNNSGSKSRDTWDSHKTSREVGMHRGSRDIHRDSYELGMSRERGEEMSKSGRDRDLLYERKKVEKSGRSMSSQPNQGGDRRSRPRTPLGSPTRRSSVGESSSYHGKDRGTTEQARRNNSYSKNYHAS